MSEIQSWSATAASNNSASPDGWPESMAPSGINNSARENMAALARWYKDSNGSLTSGGSSNAYTLTPNRTISAYASGVEFLFAANHANTSTATLNVSSLGAKDLRDRDGAALASGEIESGAILHAVYDNSNGYFRVTNLITGLGAGTTNLDSLTDVAISTATSGDLLRYNGTSWVNATLAASLAAASETVSGIVELATAAEALTGSSQALALTPYSMANNASKTAPGGYIKFPGGVIVVWGAMTAAASTTTSDTLAATVSSSRWPLLTMNEFNTTTRSPVKVYSHNSTSLTVHNPNAVDIGVFYWVIGY